MSIRDAFVESVYLTIKCGYLYVLSLGLLRYRYWLKPGLVLLSLTLIMLGYQAQLTLCVETLPFFMVSRRYQFSVHQYWFALRNWLGGGQEFGAIVIAGRTITMAMANATDAATAMVCNILHVTPIQWIFA